MQPIDLCDAVLLLTLLEDRAHPIERLETRILAKRAGVSDAYAWFAMLRCEQAGIVRRFAQVGVPHDTTLAPTIWWTLSDEAISVVRRRGQ